MATKGAKTTKIRKTARKSTKKGVSSSHATAKKKTKKRGTMKRKGSRVVARTTKRSTKNSAPPAVPPSRIPSVGAPAPAFALPDQNGRIRTLDEARGSWLLLYFYPKDDTPGCTKEACAIRDGFPFFEKLQTLVYGISVDSVKSHKKFSEKYNLPFTLLSDEKKQVVAAYGVWGEKVFMGRRYMGTNRVSFLVAPDGTIAKVYTDVNPATHADQVLTDLRALRGD